ncbi:hypothetical protein BHE74_00018298 [Ensete ventricosum]|nr:hypothetical protein GW17_00023296 [Ensete ventricosum]RWW73791.1 hypothetical protein BHE74_00018298 [Ensete ventricosum]RZR92500.1 hypothetical protein BHM03_00020811 [Ensete ventricosum]
MRWYFSGPHNSFNQIIFIWTKHQTHVDRRVPERVRGYLDDSGGIPARLTVANHDDLREATAVDGGGHDRGRTRRASEFAPRGVGASRVVRDAVRPLDAKSNYNSLVACDLGENRVRPISEKRGRLEMVSITNLEEASGGHQRNKAFGGCQSPSGRT